jgi:Holliday junction resolvase
LSTKNKALFLYDCFCPLQARPDLIPPWSRFGGEGEFVVSLYLRSKGWNIQLSKGSRGPADITAIRKSTKWLIQVKASTRIPKLKGYEVKRLIQLSEAANGSPIVAILQPIETAAAIINSAEKENISNMDFRFISKGIEAINFGNYALIFYSLPDWKVLRP